MRDVKYAIIPAVLTLCAAAWGGEVPRRAEEFVDSIGINAHIDVPTSVYNETVIGQSGIRHLRSTLKPGATTLQTRLTNLFTKYGISTNLACDNTAYTPSQIRDLAKQQMVESVEGLNEPDSAGPRSYGGFTDNIAAGTYPATILYQQQLFDAMLADPVTALKPVLSPAMGNPANSGHLRGIAADFVSMHSYPAQEMPTGNYLTSFAIPNAQMMAGDMPLRLVATETGYKSGTAWNDISATATTKYVPRLFAEYFRLGVARTFLFEMTDTGQYNYGLMDVNFAPKPAYNALKNMIAILRESSWNATTKKWSTPATYYPSMLDYNISSASPNVHHVLLQKSSGKLYLMLWQEVPSYDLTLRRDITNAAVAVDVTFNTGITNAALYRLSSTTPQSTYTNVSSLRVSVPDEVVILELTPGTPAAAPVAGPVVSIATTVANTSAVLGQSGSVTVSRTGATTSSLTVGYTVSGTAVAGRDYDALSGSVVIPAGASSATITVTPRNTAIVGRKNLVLTLSSNAAYGISTSRSAAVYFGNSRNLVCDFNSGLSGWVGNTLSKTTWTTTAADTGAGAMQLTMTVRSTDRWLYSAKMNFAAAQDWSAVSKLVLRVKESSANPATDLGRPIYFTWYNNGAAVGGGFGAAKFPMTLDSNYRTVTLDLGNLPRDKVTGLFFYVDGATLAPGTHVVTIDNIMAMSETNGVLDDFEEYGVGNWSRSGQSAVSLEKASVDSGLQAMRWTFNANGVRWDNCVKLNLPLPTDLGRYSTLRLRFKEDANNAGTDVGRRIYVDWFNNGVRANGSAGVAAIALRSPGGYRTVEINITDYKRDAVTGIFFYVDGGAFASGPHVWYLDSISVY